MKKRDSFVNPGGREDTRGESACNAERAEDKPLTRVRESPFEVAETTLAENINVFVSCLVRHAVLYTLVYVHLPQPSFLIIKGFLHLKPELRQNICLG